MHWTTTDRQAKSTCSYQLIMQAERAGYTVTMFLVDISPSMGKECDPEDEPPTIQLKWALRFVKLKIQEMIYNNRKTDQCGVIVFGSEGTDNVINANHGGYEHVSEYIPIAQPNAATLAKLDELEPSETAGDPIDALIVGIETQAVHLANKRTWTRKIVLVTNGESPIEVEDWEATVRKMDSLKISLTVVGVEFDDNEFPYHEPDKSVIKRENEKFYAELTSSLSSGVVGTCAFALREVARPDIKGTRSVLMSTVLRLGDVDVRPEEALELPVKTSKCTAISRPRGWKKFGKRERAEGSGFTDRMQMDKSGEGEGEDEDEESDQKKVTYAQLVQRTEFFVDRSKGEEGETEGNGDGEDGEVVSKAENVEKVEKEQLVRGFKYGSTYVPCPEGQFVRLNTRRGIDILGFFRAEEFRQDLKMGEIQYIWADPSSSQQQIALSSIVQAMKGREDGTEKELYAIARWVTRDGADPKMGVLAPCVFEKVDCLLWAQMPFADDVRKYTFPSLMNLVSKKGEVITKHPYIPTDEQLAAMDKFVDTMDLMEAGEMDEEGHRAPWFDTTMSYNPAVHRAKQAMFHCAVVSDLNTNPLPPPHPELLQFLKPPKRVLKRAKATIEECTKAFNVKEVPKKVAKQRKDGHVRATEDGDDGEMLLLDVMKPKNGPSQSKSQLQSRTRNGSQRLISQRIGVSVKHTTNADDSGSEADSDVNQEELFAPATDGGRASGKIIGTTYPLADFQKNIAKGDLVSKAVEDLAWAIQEIIKKPFGMRRGEEMLITMSVLRETALKEDEIEAWNAFLPELRKTCMESHVLEFWTMVTKTGLKSGLITADEAKQYGGKSGVTQAEAEKLFSK